MFFLEIAFDRPEPTHTCDEKKKLYLVFIALTQSENWKVFSLIIISKIEGVCVWAITKRIAALLS